jgi:hypothetical protein
MEPMAAFLKQHNARAKRKVPKTSIDLWPFLLPVELLRE